MKITLPLVCGLGFSGRTMKKESHPGLLSAKSLFLLAVLALDFTILVRRITRVNYRLLRIVEDFSRIKLECLIRHSRPPMRPAVSNLKRRSTGSGSVELAHMGCFVLFGDELPAKS